MIYIRGKWLGRSAWAGLLIIAVILLAAKAEIQESMPVTDNTAYTIDITEEFENPEDTAETDLTVKPYKKTKSDTNEKILKECYTYSAQGNLKEITEYERLNEISRGVLRKDVCAGGVTYSVSADHTRTFKKRNTYVFDMDGIITSEKVMTEEDTSSPKYRADYLYTTTGKISSETFYERNDEKDLMYQVSITTYNYNSKDILISSSTSYSDENTDLESEYINNSNGMPVKITTRDLSDNLISTEIRGYYRTGKLAFEKIYDGNGNINSKTYYYYDKNGYLIRDIEYALSETGAFTMNEINIYTYY